MASTNQKIGRLIYEVRRDRGLTQAEFAKRLGTSQSAVNRIERGNQNLTLETLAHISEVLDKQIISLTGRAINLRVEGGHKLSGEITCKTAKNSAVAILCASLLNKGTTRLNDVPRIEEVNRIIEVLSSIGVNIRWLNDTDLGIKVPARLTLEKMNKASARKTRVVIWLIGSLMHDYSTFKIPYAGGCELGRRTVLPHSYALEEFGTKIIAHDGHYNVSVRRSLPKKPVIMYEMSDGATENILIAAARMNGETIIKQASANYFPMDLCYFLQALGVKIEGIGTHTLKVKGVKDIKKNITYHISEDPLEAITFISAAVTTDSSITIKRASINFLEFELLKLEKMGLKFGVSSPYKAKNGQTDLADIKIYSHNGTLKAPEEKLHPLPGGIGINIDHLPYFVPIAAIAKGRTLIHDWVYEDRTLMYTEMKKIGVNIELADPHRIFIDGPTRWRSADVIAPNGLRPAVMLLIGMLAAPGISMLRNVYTINRGYEDLANRLNSLGAHIEVVHEV